MPQVLSSLWVLRVMEEAGAVMEKWKKSEGSKSTGFKAPLGSTPALALIRHVRLACICSLSLPQFPCMWNWDNKGSSWGMRWVCVKHGALGLAWQCSVTRGSCAVIISGGQKALCSSTLIGRRLVLNSQATCRRPWSWQISASDRPWVGLAVGGGCWLHPWVNTTPLVTSSSESRAGGFLNQALESSSVSFHPHWEENKQATISLLPFIRNQVKRFRRAWD